MIKFRFVPIVGSLVALIGYLANYVSHHSVAVLSPQGQIAAQERSLIISATLLMLVVVVPVFGLTLYISVKYRAGNRKAKHTPDWDHSFFLEAAWWAIPGIIIAILAVMTWHSSYSLDPFRKLSSTKAPVNIQVVALQWKWLFIYPDQHIATINYFKIPVDQPINFQITADAPMNSFWIPQLGGQIYAMPGMATELHLIASRAGDYRGSSANISGSGFASMNFTASAGSKLDFESWVNQVKNAPQPLTNNTYNALTKPATSSIQYYSSISNGLFANAILKYMAPQYSQPGGNL